MELIEVTEQERWKLMQARVAKARVALKASEHPDLSSRMVMRILATFGPHLKIPRVFKEEPKYRKSAVRGWQRRAWNAILCAEKVAPFWEEIAAVWARVSEEAQQRCYEMYSRFPDSIPDCIAQARRDYPPEVNLSPTLTEAKRLVQSGTPSRTGLNWEAIPSMDTVSSCLYSQRSSLQIRQAVGAYIAFEHAIGTVLHDIESDFELNLTYCRSCGDWWTAPNVIGAAWTIGGIGGIPQNPSSWFPDYDDQAREEFWLWWLDEAVPASWNLQDI